MLDLTTIKPNTPLTDTQAKACIATVPLFTRLIQTDAIREPTLIDILTKHTTIQRPREGEIIARRGTHGGASFFPIHGSIYFIPPAMGDKHLRDIGLADNTQTISGWRAALQAFWRTLHRPTPDFAGTKHHKQTPKLTRNLHPLLSNPKKIINLYTKLYDARLLPLEENPVIGANITLTHGLHDSTHFAGAQTTLLRMEWLGIRTLFRSCEAFRDLLHEDNSASDARLSQLQSVPWLAKLPLTALRELAAGAEVEIYKHEAKPDTDDQDQNTDDTTDTDNKNETPVTAQGAPFRGIFMVLSGFARVSQDIDSAEVTQQYLRRGDFFGIPALAEGIRTGIDTATYLGTVRAISQLEVLRIPADLSQKHIAPLIADGLPPELQRTILSTGDDWLTGTAVLDVLIHRRVFNGTRAMLIDTDRCVQCDLCVQACANNHDGNPRFVRTGHHIDNIMIATACMHCADPLCMFNCPTAAIQRASASGNVIIDHDTCIGCGACANDCPHENIRLVEMRDTNGAFITDPDTGAYQIKATKCDYCYTVKTGPACENACPHDALFHADMADNKQLMAMQTRMLGR